MSENHRIVEINGVKLEIDLRTAKVIENFRVGDTIKVLIKYYGDQFKCLPGVIISFVDFKNRPTIEILYVDEDGGVKFASINQDSKDIEIAPALGYEFTLSRGTIEARIQRDLDIKQAELDSALRRLKLFNQFFGQKQEESK